MAYDQETARRGFAGPGQDTRQWLSVGTVKLDTEEARSLRFNDAEGNPLPFPVVDVTLQPSAIDVTCRIANDVAGDGEGDWHPIVGGDEVLVAIPEGDESGWPIVVKRLSNAIDAWPRTVAGMDATKNTFAFRRVRTPYVFETAHAYLVRNAATGSQIALDEKGQFLVNDGDGARIFLGADAVGFSSADGDTTVQVQVASNQLLLQAAGTTQLTMAADGSQFLTQGTLAVATGGLGATGHAITLEQVSNLIANFVIVMNALGAWAMPFTVSFNAGFPGTLAAIMTTLLQGAASPATPTATTPGGALDSIGLAALIPATLLTQPPDLAGLTGVPTPYTPGIGRQSFLF